MMNNIENNIEFLCDISEMDRNNIIMIINIADDIIFNLFNKRCNDFSIVICDSEWAMTVQGIIHKKEDRRKGGFGDDTYGISFTDTRLKEIVIRKDKANFGNYLHEMVFAVLYNGLPEHLREALAWYFTLELLKPYRYTNPPYPNWVIDIYLQPIRYFVSMFGAEFTKDFALGRAEVEESLLPEEIRRLFLPEEYDTV